MFFIDLISQNAHSFRTLSYLLEVLQSETALPLKNDLILKMLSEEGANHLTI